MLGLLAEKLQTIVCKHVFPESLCTFEERIETKKIIHNKEL
jgi:hypothetical protein